MAVLFHGVPGERDPAVPLLLPRTLISGVKAGFIAYAAFMEAFQPSGSTTYTVGRLVGFSVVQTAVPSLVVPPVVVFQAGCEIPELPEVLQEYQEGGTVGWTMKSPGYDPLLGCC